MKKLRLETVHTENLKAAKHAWTHGVINRISGRPRVHGKCRNVPNIKTKHHWQFQGHEDRYLLRHGWLVAVGFPEQSCRHTDAGTDSYTSQGRSCLTRIGVISRCLSTLSVLSSFTGEGGGILWVSVWFEKEYLKSDVVVLVERILCCEKSVIS